MADGGHKVPEFIRRLIDPKEKKATMDELGKLLYQLSIMYAAIAAFVVSQGCSVSDSSAEALAASLT